jgi:FAD/FMN-containing dehydrogenase
MPAARIDESMLRSLRERMRGTVLTADDAGYGEARKVWNGRFDRRPAAIARCVGPGDVAAALEIARRSGLPLAVRSGGHDYAGNSMCEDGVVIDLSQMKAVNVDRAARTVRVGPGARWAAVDREAQAFGLATTGGTVSTVGVAGFILGGGSGHLARKYGLGLDNLVAADVVTAAGDVLRASATENPDLFWGLRGGSGNLGIVTSLDLRLHELGTEVLTGQIIYPFDQAREVLRNYQSFTRDAPDEIQCYAFFLRLPPLPVFPEEAHGKVVIDLVATYAGDVREGERHLAPLRAFGRPMMDTVAPTPYVALQQAFDAGMAGGSRWYSRAHYLRELNDDAIETIVVGAESLPGDFTMVYLEAEGGAVGRVDRAATAFPHRDAPYALHIFPGWTRAADDEAIMAWAREFHRAMDPYATGGVYVNLLGGDEADGARMAYGSNYDQLAELKRRFDPENLLRHNHNVPPMGNR